MSTATEKPRTKKLRKIRSSGKENGCARTADTSTIGYERYGVASGEFRRQCIYCTSLLIQCLTISLLVVCTTNILPFHFCTAFLSKLQAECAGMYFEEQGPGFRCPQCSGPRRRYAKKVGDRVGTTLDGGDAPILLFSFGGVALTIAFGIWAVNNL